MQNQEHPQKKKKLSVYFQVKIKIINNCNKASLAQSPT